MDPAYHNWLWLLFIGAFVGSFLRPRTIVKMALVVEGIAIAGLAACAMFSVDRLSWIFGLLAMAVPVVALVTAVGAMLGSGIRSALSRRAQK